MHPQSLKLQSLDFFLKFFGYWIKKFLIFIFKSLISHGTFYLIFIKNILEGKLLEGRKKHGNE